MSWLGGGGSVGGPAAAAARANVRAGKRPVAVVVLDDGDEDDLVVETPSRPSRPASLAGFGACVGLAVVSVAAVNWLSQVRRQRTTAPSTSRRAAAARVPRTPGSRRRDAIVIDDDEQPEGEARGRGGGAGAAAGGGEPAAAALVRPAGGIACPICMCDSEDHESVELSNCGHTFCEECITTYVRGKVQAGDVLPDQLGCPKVDPKRCGEALAPRDVRALLEGPRDVERYERLALQRCAESGDDMGACPSAGCTYLFVWEPDQDRRLACPLCEKTFCLACKCEPWHEGKKCEEFAAERGDVGAADKCFEEFAKSKMLRKCPKCSSFVEKTGGCDAMHCRCNLVFCYRCTGALKTTARASGIKACGCGREMEQLLRAHDGRANHNLVNG